MVTEAGPWPAEYDPAHRIIGHEAEEQLKERDIRRVVSSDHSLQQGGLGGGGLLMVIPVVS